MTDRDRLIELFKKINYKVYERSIKYNLATQFNDYALNQIVDELLANGVIVPPCPIGTEIYMLVTKRARLNLPPFTFVKDSKLTFYNLERVIEEFGKTVFLTRKEAEQALKEMKEKAGES